jgi:hypothetical protein
MQSLRKQQTDELEKGQRQGCPFFFGVCNDLAVPGVLTRTGKAWPIRPRILVFAQFRTENRFPLFLELLERQHREKPS